MGFTNLLALFLLVVLLSGCFQQERDPCEYDGLPGGFTSTQDTLIVRAILDSNGLKAVRASMVAFLKGRLDFGYLQLDSFYFPAIASELQSVREISFVSNRLKQIPAGISIFKEATLLDFTDNRIHSLSDELFAMGQVKSLLLGYNLLTSLPSEIGRLKALTVLRLDQNSLFTVPPEMKSLATALQRCSQPTLYIAGNYLCSLTPDMTGFMDFYAEEGWRESQFCP